MVQQNVLASIQQTGTDKTDFDNYVQRSIDLLNTNRIAEAITVINEMQRKAVNEDNSIGIYQSYIYMGHIHRRYINTEEAEKCYRNALKVIEKGNNQDIRNEVLGYLACTLLMNNDYKQALEVCEESGSIGSVHNGVPLLMMTAATCYYLLGRIPEAQAMYYLINENADLDSLRHGEPYHIVHALHLNYIGRYDEAVKYLDNACKEDMNKDDQIFNVTEIEILRDMYFDHGDISKAMELLNVEIEHILMYINSAEIDRLVFSEANSHMLILQSETKKIKSSQTLLMESNREMEADHLILLRERELSDNRMRLLQMRTDSIYQRNQRLDMERKAHLTSMNRMSIMQSNKKRERLISYWIGGACALLILFAASVILLAMRHRNMKDIKRQNLRLKQEHARIMELKDSVKVATHEKEMFIRQMSHEIRTPLNAINGFTQILADADMIGMLPDEEKNELYSQLHKNASDMNRIIFDIMLLTDLDNGTCLSAATNDKLTEYAIECLRHNAEKFAGEGKYTVSREEKNGGITIIVEDHGPGIPEGMDEKIFERFFKVDSFVQGAGLGLPLARAIARKLGGDVTLDTAYKEGARFIFKRALMLIACVLMSFLTGTSVVSAQDYTDYYEISDLIKKGETLRAMYRTNRMGRTARNANDSFGLFKYEMCMGNVMAARLKPTTAQTHYRNAIELIEATDMKQEKCLAYARLSRVLNVAHDYTEAENIANKGLQLTNKGQKLYLWLLLNKCLAEYNTGKMAEFMKDYSTMIKLYPSSGVSADEDEYLQCQIYYHAARNEYAKASELAARSPNKNYYLYQISMKQDEKTDEYNYLKAYYQDLKYLHNTMVDSDMQQLAGIRGINALEAEQLRAQLEKEKLETQNNQLKWDRANILLENERNIERQLIEEQKAMELSSKNAKLDAEAKQAFSEMELRRVSVQREKLLESRQRVITTFTIVAILVITTLAFLLLRHIQVKKLKVINAKLKESTEEAELHLRQAQKEQAVRNEFMGRLRKLMEQPAADILRDAAIIVDKDKTLNMSAEEMAHIAQQILDNTDKLTKVVNESFANES